MREAAGSADAGWRRRRLHCLVLLAGTIPIGIAWRMLPLHLPPFAFKYGGSALWAVAVYWLVAGLLPNRPVPQLAALAALITSGVELGKLVFWPPLDRFRETLAGKLLLGRYFTFGALAAYWLAIGFVAWLDDRFGFGQPQSGHSATPIERDG